MSVLTTPVLLAVVSWSSAWMERKFGSLPVCREKARVRLRPATTDGTSPLHTISISKATFPSLIWNQTAVNPFTSIRVVCVSMKKVLPFRLSGKFVMLRFSPFEGVDASLISRGNPAIIHSVYHSPVEGFYDSENDNGLSNTNDIFLFMTDTNTQVLNVRGDPRAGNGQMYVFQFPVNYFASQDTSTLEVIPIGNVRGYQAKTAPVMASGGRALYWNMVRGEVRAWVDQRFSRGHSGTLNLERGDPPYIAGRASPTLSHDPVMDYSVYGPGADAVVWKADRLFVNVSIVETDAVVSSRLAVTPDDAFVVFGTHSGGLFWAPTDDISAPLEIARLNPIRGDLAVDSTRLFVGDDQGNGVGQIVAFEMASNPVTPTVTPTAAPVTTAPSVLTTRAPTTAPTVSPVTSLPTVTPTRIDMITDPTVAPTLDIADDETAAPSRVANVVETSKATPCFSTAAPAVLSVFLGAVMMALFG